MKRKILFALLLTLLLLVAASAAYARLDGYSISWWTVDGGGGTSSANGYTLNGTLGQPDAGTVSSGGGYTLAGGFWHGGAVVLPELKLFLPLLTK
jgi:hypothetical protein